jgi:hypothetical protein
MMRSFKFLLMAAVVALTASPSPGAAQEVQKLKMLYTAVNGFASAYVAQEQGFFKKRGFEVEFVPTNSSGNNPPAMVAGSVQVGGPTMPTILQANDAGLDIVVFAGGTVYPLAGDMLIARQGSGIEKTTDLKGKRVGVPGLGALLHVMLRRNLKANGIDPDSEICRDRLPQAGDAPKCQIDAYPSQVRSPPASCAGVRGRQLAQGRREWRERREERESEANEFVKTTARDEPGDRHLYQAAGRGGRLAAAAQPDRRRHPRPDPVLDRHLQGTGPDQGQSGRQVHPVPVRFRVII